MTGNNANLSTDLVSRSVLIRLDAEMERPEERRFRHDDFLGFIRVERVGLISDLLTVIRYWVGQGMPRYKGESSHRMKSWAAIMGGILDTAGIPGFLENMEQLLEESDSEQEEWSQFVCLWADKFGITEVLARDLVELAFEGYETENIPGPLYTDEIARLEPKGQTKRLSHMLKKNRGRVIAGYRIIRMVARKQGHFFRLEKADDKQAGDKCFEASGDDDELL